MTELRWLLIGFGLALLGVVYLATRYGWRWPKQRASESVRVRREPVIETPVQDEMPEHGQAPAEIRPAEGESGSAVPVSVAGKVVAVRLVARDRQGFPGERLVLAMREAGLRHGRFGIFHRPADSHPDEPVFSVASLTEPGSFDLTRIKSDSYSGVSLFLVLPGPNDGVEAFDDMLNTARQLAARLEGELLDEQGSRLSVQRERFMREEVIQFEHQAAAIQ